MESSEAEEPKQREREEKCFLLSPCYFFQQLFNCFFKCFGGEKYDDIPHDQEEAPPPADGSEDRETETKLTEDQYYCYCDIQSSTRSDEIERAIKRPPRRHESSGKGGHIN